MIDSDGDGVDDTADVCHGSDDGMDADQDGVPDGCDQTPNGTQDNPVPSDLTPDESSTENASEDDEPTQGENGRFFGGSMVGGMLVLFALTWWIRFSKRGD